MKKFLLKALALPLGVALGGMASYAVIDTDPVVTVAGGDDSSVMETRPDAKGSQTWAIEKGSCVQAPEGTLPTGVVLYESGAWTFTKDVNKAFEQLIFDGAIEASEWTGPVDHGIEIGLFCV